MLSQLHLTNYVEERNKFLIGVEDLKQKPYVDTGGIPHIGIGFNLQVTKNFDLVLQELGFDVDGQLLTGEALAVEQQYIQAIRNVINNVKYPPNTKDDPDLGNRLLRNNLTQVMYARANDTRYSSSFSRRGVFEFNDNTEVMDVFNSIIDDYETIVDNKLGYHMADSKERAALVSMAYNSGSIKRKLVDAITNDNRAEAWYEIRYDSNGSNKKWLADRRYRESNMFNLYDSVFNEAGAKEIMRMYKQMAFSYQLSA